MQNYLMTQQLLGQQSIVAFMGLHLDIEKIREDNKLKPGLRKYVGVLINESDKLTKEQKAQKKQENRELYGLPRDFYKNIELPPASELKVFKVEDIVNHKKTLTVIERLKMLSDMEEHLLIKIKQKKKEEIKVQKNGKNSEVIQMKKLVCEYQGPSDQQSEEHRARFKTEP